MDRNVGRQMGKLEESKEHRDITFMSKEAEI
jgi:hypothetical protein